MSLLHILALIGAGFVLFELWWFGLRLFRAVRAGRSTILASQVGQEAAPRVLVVGDSMACGVGATDSQKSIAGLLAQDFHEFTIDNQSKTALRIGQLERKLLAMRDQQYDLVIIQIGGMDTLLFTSSQKILRSLRSIFTHAQRLGAKKIVLVSVNNVGSIPFFHFPLNVLYTRRSQRVSRLCNDVCVEAGVVHVPLFEDRYNDPLFCNGDCYFAPDGIHPNDQGYELWYKKLKVDLDAHIGDLRK